MAAVGGRTFMEVQSQVEARTGATAPMLIATSAAVVAIIAALVASAASVL